MNRLAHRIVSRFVQAGALTADFDPDAPSVGDRIYGLPFDAEDSGVILIPVPWDATTSYRDGAHSGPKAIQQASLQVERLDADFGLVYRHGIHLLDNEQTREIGSRNAEARKAALAVIDSDEPHGPTVARCLAEVNEAGGWLNDTVYGMAQTWLDRGRMVGVVGGDHSAPYGLIRAVCERHPDVGILQIDAHADLRDSYEGFEWSHASIMRNVMDRLPVQRLCQVGIRDYGVAEQRFAASDPRVVTFYDAALKAAQYRGVTWHTVCERIISQLPRKVYISFDIDGLDPALCPHTGTPVAGGLSYGQAVYLLKLLAASREVVGFDLVEVAEGAEGEDEWDGNVGARMLYKLIGTAMRGKP